MPPPIAETDNLADDYARARVDRLRLQLDRIDDMMLTEDDPQRLDRLASAQARVSEQLRIASGKPLPGSLRPQGERKGRGPGRAIEVWTAPPALPTPQPVVNSVTQPVTPTTPTTQDDVSH